MNLSRETMLARMYARDKEWNGRYLTGVLTTGIYCLPSCPARKPLAEHVRFFHTEEAAREAGLRPCRRCRPDNFYRDYHPELDELMALVERVRDNPADFPDVSEMTSTISSGGTKLHSLFRQHFHTTPAAFLRQQRLREARALLETGRPSAEVAFAAGYESLSTFYEQFRKRTGLTPGEYQRLGSSPAFTLALPATFRRADVLRQLGRDSANSTERVEGSRFIRALNLGARSGVLTMEVGHTSALCQIDLDHPTPTEMRQVHQAAIRMLGLLSDSDALEQRLKSRPEMARLVAGREGLRVLLSADLFEGLAWSIIGQQINLPFAFLLRQRLVELCGRSVSNGLSTHPTAAAVAALEYEDLTSRQYSRRKAEYLIDTARLIASGNLPLEVMAEQPATEVERRLLAVRGLGPWSVNYIMMRAFGFADCVPLGDTGLTSALKRFYGLDHRPDAKETILLMEPFAPFRSLATYHLWMSLGEPV